MQLLLQLLNLDLLGTDLNGFVIVSSLGLKDLVVRGNPHRYVVVDSHNARIRCLVLQRVTNDYVLVGHLGGFGKLAGVHAFANLRVFADAGDE